MMDLTGKPLTLVMVDLEKALSVYQTWTDDQARHSLSGMVFLGIDQGAGGLAFIVQVEPRLVDLVNPSGF